MPLGVKNRLSLPADIRPLQVNWVYVSGIFFLHGLALLAFLPWLFSWQGVAAVIFGIHFFGLGINLCYHRLLAHRSFKLPLWLEHFFVLIALCCMQDTPATWVANHRLHHATSDSERDPHSPLASFWWSHMLWLFVKNTATQPLNCHYKFARDILADPWYMRLEKGALREWIMLMQCGVFFLVGALLGFAAESSWNRALQMGLSFMVWGVFVRVVAVWHITWAVNSLTHLFGYRNHSTNDNSRNNWLIGFLAMGEGWHNNHHADPSSASVRQRWWELDIIYLEIKLLAKLGLATDIILPAEHAKATTSAEKSSAFATLNL